MTPFIFSIFVIIVTAVILYVAVKNIKSGKFLAVLIPCTLLLATTSFLMVNELMGQPKEALTQEKFLFLDYTTDGKTIYMWLIEKGSNYPTTLKMPYSEKKHKELEDAKNAKQHGKTVLGKNQTQRKAFSNEKAEEAFELYEFDPQREGLGKE